MKNQIVQLMTDNTRLQAMFRQQRNNHMQLQKSFAAMVKPWGKVVQALEIAQSKNAFTLEQAYVVYESAMLMKQSFESAKNVFTEGTASTGPVAEKVKRTAPKETVSKKHVRFAEDATANPRRADHERGPEHQPEIEQDISTI
jgi:hypothetical protein